MRMRRKGTRTNRWQAAEAEQLRSEFHLDSRPWPLAIVLLGPNTSGQLVPVIVLASTLYDRPFSKLGNPQAAAFSCAIA